MILELLYLIFIAAGALAAGNLIRKKLHRTESRLEAFLVSSGLGFIAISLLLLLLGTLKLYTTPAFIALDAILAVLIAVQIKELAGMLKPDLSWMEESPLTTKLIFTAFAGFAILNLIASSAPPTSADALLYHLAVPKIYLENHGIVSIPSLQLMSEAPESIDLLYLYGLQLLNGKLAQMIAWYLSFLASLAVFMITAKITSKRAAIVAAALFSTLPIFSVFNVRAYVDIPLTFFALLATSSFLEWTANVEMRNAALTGLFLGMTVAAKNTAILLGAGLAITAAIAFLKQQPEKKKKFAVQAVAVAAIALAMLLPWLVKSYVNTGDPVHPFLYNQLGGTYWNSELERTILEFHRSQGIGFSMQALALFPLKITINPQLFADTAGITPLFLGFLPLLLLLKKIPKQITTLLILAAALAALQFFTVQQTRYMFLTWAILSIITSYTVFSFKDEKLVQAGLYAFILLAIAINSVLWVAANADDLPAAVRLENESNYLNGKVPTYAATQHLAETDPKAGVCWYGDGRGFYSQNPYIWCNPLYQGYVNFAGMKKAADIAARMNELNITYILFQKSMLQPLLYGEKAVFSKQTTGFYDRSNQLMQEYLASYTQKAYEDGNAEIYKVIA